MSGFRDFVDTGDWDEPSCHSYQPSDSELECCRICDRKGSGILCEDCETNPPKQTADGYVLRTNAGVDIVLAHDEHLCNSCDGDGRAWTVISPNRGRYADMRCGLCDGLGKQSCGSPCESGFQCADCAGGAS
jgi:hypothetical protein